MSLSNNAKTIVSNLVTAIQSLITDHSNITGNSNTKGHVQAGGAPQTLGTSLSAGTDNGYYARADHVHTVDYSNILNKPNVIDNLTTDSGSSPLSAKQGKWLNENKASTSHEHSQYLTSHQDISGKANIADLATVAISGSYLDLSNLPENSTLTEHEHSTADVKDSAAHSNLGTSANATQSTINTAIDTKIGSLLSVELIQVVSTRPNASASTMNKLYLVPEENAETDDAYEVFVTVEDEGSYAWEKIDTTRIDLSNYVTTSDSRLTDARTPTSHTHGNIKNTGAIGSAANKPIITTTSGKLTTGSFGTSANTFCQGNDSRLSDARTPTAHTHTKSEISDFPSTMTPSSHTHSKSEITDFPSTMTPSSHAHGDITNDGKVGTTSGKPLITTTGGKITTGAFGTSSGQFAEGNHTHSGYLTSHNPVDSSLSDSSTNAVQNKVIKGALDGKASSSHSHTKSEITDFPTTMTPSSHTHGTGDISDSSAYANIGSNANATQKTINDKINTALGNKANSSNVYSKSETYTQSEITTAISNAVSGLTLFEVVTSLPTSNIKNNRLYLIANNENIANNAYDIYLRVNNSWELLDKLEFDISNYYTKTEADTLLSGKVNTSDSRLSDARTPTSHIHGNITNTGEIGSDANKPIITTTNGKLTTGSFGTSANTFCQGNDSRLSDARTPTAHTHTKSEISDFPSTMTPSSHTHTKSEISDFPSTMTPSSHTHGDITNDGKLGSTANKPLITTTNGKVTTGSFGTSANTFCQGNDSRLSDARTPTAHTHTKSEISDFPSTMTPSSHTHSKSEITDFPSTMTPSSHTHGNLQNDGTVKISGTVQKSKNLVTDSNGNLSTEDKYSHPSSHPASMITGLSNVATSGSYNDLSNKPTIPTVPSASSTTPSADTANGSVGTGTTWAKADHTHPKSTIYAESVHTHSKSEITDFPVTEMDSATLNTSNLYASSSFVNFIRMGNKVMATGVLNTVSLANTNNEYNVFNGLDHTKPSSDVTVKCQNLKNTSSFTFKIKTNGSGYVKPNTANTSGTLFFNVVYSV